MTMLIIDTDTGTDRLVTGSEDTASKAASTDSVPNVWALLVSVPKAVSACMAYLLSAPDGPVSTPVNLMRLFATGNRTVPRSPLHRRA